MSKRTTGLPRRRNDGYDTPAHACTELLKHLLPGTRFIEPCMGQGDLARHLIAAGHRCVYGFDLEPRVPREAGWPVPVRSHDATVWQLDPNDHDSCLGMGLASTIITNPPWTRELLHPIIENLSNQLPTWLLFDSDWAVNAKTPKHLLDRCERIVAQGRVRWMEGHPDDKGHGSVDNVCWYRFDATHSGGPRWFNRRGR